MFKERKAAQLAAALLDRAGGRLNVLKLTKLLYLVEREAMNRHGFQISDDQMVSMPKGPVLSNTLDLTNGFVESAEWDALIEDREQHDVKLKVAIARQELTALNDSTIDIVNAIWAEFGHMSQWDLVKYTHDQCAEWEDPDGSSLPIPAKRVFMATGKSAAEAEVMAKEMRAQQYFDRLLEDVDG
ncbi:Panacea domain-containing protein [Undibacterium griseum]|uniref:SocA family protein n=1 Tax=Undibacterium griseum TaxID=2762295 RepID=A0ABR6YP23_9BURK|nr:Panacea domain-containing protein [Undibacterium griseum]MBC3885649.1 SocA family protein [Undibacterium griseum]